MPFGDKRAFAFQINSLNMAIDFIYIINVLSNTDFKQIRVSFDLLEYLLIGYGIYLILFKEIQDSFYR